MGVGLEGVVVDWRVCNFQREVCSLDVVDAVLARLELEFEADNWESHECQQDEEDTANLALRN